MVDDAIIVRISPYGLLGTCGRDSTPAFEVDDVDRQYHGSRSVVARGHRLGAEGHPVPSAASGAPR